MNRKSVFIGLLMLSLTMFIEVSLTYAATLDVNMGDGIPNCSSWGISDIGFVDCTSNTGGILQTAITTITAGDTVRWTMRATPMTATSGTQPTPGACATGDNFDSGTGNAFTPGLIFTHTFNTAGSCNYFCIIHPTTMFGTVNVAPPPTTTTSSTTTTTTTTTTTSTTTSTTTTTTTSTTTTTVKENCNDQNNGKGKDKGKGHNKGKCKGPGKDK